MSSRDPSLHPLQTGILLLFLLPVPPCLGHSPLGLHCGSHQLLRKFSGVPAHSVRSPKMLQLPLFKPLSACSQQRKLCHFFVPLKQNDSWNSDLDSNNEFLASCSETHSCLPFLVLAPFLARPAGLTHSTVLQVTLRAIRVHISATALHNSRMWAQVEWELLTSGSQHCLQLPSAADAKTPRLIHTIAPLFPG